MLISPITQKRNEICNCGSGLKYKKCCITNIVPMIDALNNMNSYTVPSSFYDELYGRDILNEDGSKDYANVRGGYITIKRPAVVSFVDGILNQSFSGWGYMPTLNKALKSGKITEQEHTLIMRILD